MPHNADGAADCIHWDAKAVHGDGLAGESRDRVVMFAGTGSTRGWEGWLQKIRRRHSLGMDDWKYRNGARVGESPSETRRGSEVSSADGEATRVES